MLRLALAIALGAAFLFAQQTIPVGPPHDSGQRVTPVFEGWFPNPDGSFSMLFGYFNQNFKEEPDIPIGADNRIEPGGPDQGQPTHFLPRRRWGLFTVTVPKDFGDNKLIWTIVSNGKLTQIPARLNPLWEISPFRDATNNTPPFIAFSQEGPFTQGPRGQSTSLSAQLPGPVTLTVWVADDANLAPGATAPKTPPVTVAWSKFRGPGSVTFSSDNPPVEKLDFKAPENTVFSGKATTTATFDQPGEYVLYVAANDWSGEGGRGFQCCWSNARVNVSVK
jgi:hypothetical protein